MATRESRSREVLIDASPGCQLRGKLSLPPISLGVTVMLCDGGPRADAERFIAESLETDGCATLCVQLSSGLTDPASNAHPVRDNLEVLAARLVAVTEWLSQSPEMQPMNIGYFASGAASAAAFLAAARAPDYIDAIVAVAGRPDLAGDELDQVRAATLLVTIDNGPNLEINRRALARLRAEKSLALVSTTLPLFEDRFALKRVAEVSSKWFVNHLMQGSHSIPA
jgi:putative phosphoribosyl transferase